MWPDWSGETTIIIATGPSAVEIPKGPYRAIVIKSSWRLAPWSDVLYGIDKGWWIENRGAPKFKRLKVSPSPTACRVFGLRQVSLKNRAEILTGETGVLGCGLNTGGGFSGFQSINLAIQFGAKKIILVGFDMNGGHWNPDQRGVGKPDLGRMKSWRLALDGCADQFMRLGVEVINASENSALTSYPKMSLSEALHGGSGQGDASEHQLRSHSLENPFKRVAV